MGKHLLTVTAIPFLFFNQLQLCGVFEYCDILRVRPQGRNTKPHHPIVPSSTFFLPLRQMCSMFPPSIAFCGHILMAWNILSLSSQPGLPSARFYFGCSFCISPYPWKSVLSVCPTSGGCCVAYCVYGSPSPASTGWCVCRGWCGVTAEDQRSEPPGVLACGTLCVSPFHWASASPSVKWRVVSSTPDPQVCGRELSLLK